MDSGLEQNGLGMGQVTVFGDPKLTNKQGNTNFKIFEKTIDSSVNEISQIRILAVCI